MRAICVDGLNHLAWPCLAWPGMVCLGFGFGFGYGFGFDTRLGPIAPKSYLWGSVFFLVFGLVPFVARVCVCECVCCRVSSDFAVLYRVIVVSFSFRCCYCCLLLNLNFEWCARKTDGYFLKMRMN